MTERYFREPNLASTDAVRQHYVPQMLLAQFAIKQRVGVYDLVTDKEFQSSMRNIGVEKRVNDLEVNGETLSTESWLAGVEGAAGPVMKSIVADPSALLTLSEQDERAFARFLAAQIFRVPAFREWERGVQASIVTQLKNFAKQYYQRTLQEKEFRLRWSEWESKPDEWWLDHGEPAQPAEGSTFMLGEIKGFANLLRAMSWQIGFAHPRFALYTSDNPVSRYLPPVRPWWSGGALAEHVYYIPLSTRVLLRADPELDDSGRGKRECSDFSAWETSFARHMVTKNATRFLFGPGPYVPRECALSCLRRIDANKVRDAMRLQGYDPRPPSFDLPEDDPQPP